MIGSDGLPNDPTASAPLGYLSRVLGHYSRQEGLFSLAEAVRKMTGMPAQRFGLAGRGLVRNGFAADLVLFDPESIIDTATFSNPIRAAAGIAAVWVNGVLSYTAEGSTGKRGGSFLPRAKTSWIQ